MKTLSRKQMIQVCIMLFGLFFGAGNLIFPPLLGKQAGSAAFVSLGTFSVTAIILPIMGVIAVARSRGLNNLGNRVGKWFGIFYTSAIYLSIGPGLGIPRAASTPFEMTIAPYLPDSSWVVWARLGYSIVFFAVAFWLCLTPSKIVERLGKFLTPVLLFMISVLFIGVFFNHPNGVGQPVDLYAQNPYVKGFLEGYNTMDAVAALNFGLVIALAIESFGIQSQKTIINLSIKAGIVAGCVLYLIYSMLTYIGMSTGTLFPETTNGAQILTAAASMVFGTFGPILLGSIFTLACLTTCVGLITSSSHYFSALSKRVTYRQLVILWTVSSAVLANAGLDWLLKFSVPVLIAIYPISIVFIIIGCLLPERTHQWRMTYRLSAVVVLAISIPNALASANVLTDLYYSYIGVLPFHEYDLGWVVPACVAVVVGIMWDLSKERTLEVA